MNISSGITERTRRLQIPRGGGRRPRSVLPPVAVVRTTQGTRTQCSRSSADARVCRRTANRTYSIGKGAYLLLLLSDLGNARVIIEAVLLIETITPLLT